MKSMSVRRYNRLAQLKRRQNGSNRSYITEIENLQILLAWHAGELSDSQVCQALNVETILDATILRDNAIAAGMELI